MKYTCKKIKIISYHLHILSFVFFFFFGWQSIISMYKNCLADTTKKYYIIWPTYQTMNSFFFLLKLQLLQIRRINNLINKKRFLFWINRWFEKKNMNIWINLPRKKNIYKRGKVNLTAHVTDFHCHFYYNFFVFCFVWGKIKKQKKKTDMNLRLAFIYK